MMYCRRCGAPYLVGKDLTWHENSVITQAKDPDHRMLFYQSENLEQLFQGVEEIVGVPIGDIVI